MPDGDIVHRGLRRLYQKPYRQLCEGVVSSEECARALLNSLKRDLQARGNLPIMLSQAMADRIEQTISSSEAAEENDFVQLSREFESIVQQADGSHNVKELVLRAGKAYLNDLRYGREVNIANTSEAIWSQYAHEVYESAFKERISLTSEHYKSVSQETLEQRIEVMQSSVNVGIQKFAQDALKNQSVAKLS
ncbi:MAG: hypothetical protein AAF609_25160, partial [Cyanobacteria bacterium P01_C01_bin.120]